MSEQPYKKPPIVEGVIDIRFAEPIDDAAVGRASAHFASLYPHEQTVRSLLGVEVGMPPSPEGTPTTQINQQIGQRRSSIDISEIVLLWPTSFIMAQLAPYPGWESFFGRFVRDWEIWKRTVGYRKIIRMGVRFINRIDVPIKDGIVEETEYLNVYPKLPDIFGPWTGYGVQVQVPLRDIGCNLIINSGAVPSPLLGHGSFMLDFDIYTESDIPQNDENIYKLLNRVRLKKNEVFEACITNRAREFFQK